MKNSKQIHFRKGYKYQLAQDYVIQTSFRPCFAVKLQFLELSLEGLLKIKSGYAWDGASGPAIDSDNFMRASLVHDALYQLMRLNHLKKSAKVAADQLLVKITREDGMSRIRCWWILKGLKYFGARNVASSQVKKVFRVPR